MSDVFIGRQKLESGFESFISLNKKKGVGGGSCVSTIDCLVSLVCWSVRNGETITFTEIPDKVEPRTICREQVEFRYLREGVVLSDEQLSQPYIIPGIEYIPLTSEQFKELEKLYEAEEEMKIFPNPFISKL